jgi:hypothetical protein
MKSTILPFLCLLLGTAVGWFSGAESILSASDEKPSRISPRQERERSRSSSLVIPADIAARLAPIHAADSPEERLRAVIHLAQTIPVAELHRWYDAKWLKLQDGGDLNVFYEITRNRWLAEDPTGVLELALAKNWDNFHELSNRWARSDPDRALTYLQSIKNPADRNRFELSMISTLAASRPTEALELVKLSAPPTYTDHLWETVLPAFANHHPELLKTMDLPPGYREISRGLLIRNRLEKDFSGELGRLITSPTGLADFEAALNDYDTAKKLAKNLLAQVDQLPADWINSLAGKAYMLTRNDPEAWLALDLAALGMSKSNVEEMRNTAWQQLADSSPIKVLEDLSNPGSDMNIQLYSALTSALRILNRTSPELAAEWATYYDSRTNDQSLKAQLRQALVQESESQQKPSAESLLERFRNQESSNSEFANEFHELSTATPAVQREFASAMVTLDPLELSQIGYANDSHSIDRFPIDLQATLIESMITHPPAEITESQQQILVMTASKLSTNWTQEDPAAASRWASGLPAGEPRQWAMRNVAANWMPYDPLGAQKWLNQLPPDDRAVVEKFLETEGPR